MYIKLTLEQKIHYYKQALRTFRDAFSGPYICNVLKALLNDDDMLGDEWPDSDEFCKYTFPEFYKQLLEYDSTNPYPIIDNSKRGNELRELFLNNAIKMCENENRIDG